MTDYFFSRDYNQDLWRWSKIYDTIKNYTPTSKNDPKLDKIQTDIIGAKDPGLAFFAALFTSYKIDLMQQVIIDAKSAKYSYAFAGSIFGSDVGRLQEIVIASKNIKFICQFGCNIAGADIKRLEPLIIKANNPKYANAWIKHVEPINFNKLKNIIIKSPNVKPKFLYNLAHYLTSKKDIRKVENLIIKSGSCLYIRLFAANIPDANIHKLEEFILKTNNSKEIRKFANIKGSRLNNFSLLF